MAKRDRSSAEMARRVRAALGYAVKAQDEVAADVGFSTRELSRWANGHDTPGAAELGRLAEATGVPLEFLRHGFTQQAIAQLSQMQDDAEVAMRTSEDMLRRVDRMFAGLEAREAQIAERERSMGITPPPGREAQDASLHAEDQLRQEELDAEARASASTQRGRAPGGRRRR